MERNLVRPIAHWRQAMADREAISFRGQAYTWGEWAGRIARLAAVLRGHGVGNGERVAILGQNSHRHVEAFYAAVWAGGIAVPLNWRLSLPELLETVRDCEPTVILADTEFEQHAQALAASLPHGVACIRENDYESLLAAATEMPGYGQGGDKVACLIYTGGTTGRAKGVMLTHDNLVANVENVTQVLPFDRYTVQLHCGALFHLSALWRVFTITHCGGRHVVLPRFEVDDVLDAIAEHRVNAAAFVPTMIGALLDSPRFTPQRMASLQVITYGASPVSEDLLERLMRALPACGLYQGYGMTETSPAVTFSSPAEHTPGNPRLRSCGRPVPNVELRIADAADCEVPAGVVGEVHVRGVTVMKGYWRSPELTSQAVRGGWMHTGDAGLLDVDGFLFIVDRLKDMIVTGGENVYSAEVENAIATHPAVAACAVFGIPDPRWGEAVHAVVVVRAGFALTAADVQEHCRSRIAGYKCPKSVELQGDPLPLSGANKVLKGPLREKWWAQEARNVA